MLYIHLLACTCIYMYQRHPSMCKVSIGVCATPADESETAVQGCTLQFYGTNHIVYAYQLHVCKGVMEDFNLCSEGRRGLRGRGRGRGREGANGLRFHKGF